jgi:hypothetical protein
MIWHATPEAPSEQDKDSLEKTVRYAEVIELMRRPVPPSSEQKVEKSGELQAGTAGQAPPSPVPWWRVQQEADAAPEVPRPILQSPQQLPVPIPIRSAPTPPAQPIQASPEVTKAEPVSEAAVRIDFARYKEAGVAYLTRSVAWLRSSGAKVWGSSATGFSAARQHASRIVRSVDWKDHLSRGRSSAQHAMAVGAASTRRYIERSQSTLQKLSRSGVEHSRRVTVNLRQSISGHGNEFPVWAKRMGAKLPTINGARVRVVLTGAPLRMRIFFARKITEWSLKHDGKPADARLWTSMTLAAISAIIALIIVSVVPHYASRFLPSRLAATQSTVSANAAEPAVTPVSSAPQAVLKNTSASVAVPAVGKKPQSTRAVAAKAAPASKTQRHSNDDYVAPDTYKYYGNTSQ